MLKIKLSLLSCLFVPILEALQENLKTVEKYVVLCEVDEMPETILKNAISYEEYIQDGDENYSWPTLEDDAACALCYTSGTTEIPKEFIQSQIKCNSCSSSTDCNDYKAR